MIEIKKLSITYRSTGQKVLNDLSFSVVQSEVVAIMGPSGCGKTTLLAYIQGSLTQEEVEAKGNVTWDSRVESIRTVFQEPCLLPWKNALENVELALPPGALNRVKRTERSLLALKSVGLTEAASKYPSQLSMGMKQRVNFARAVLVKPDILLLDEPFSALDTKTKTEVIDKFRDVIRKDKITTIFVTHDVSEAERIADRIITLDDAIVSIRPGNKRASQTRSSVDKLLELDY